MEWTYRIKATVRPRVLMRVAHVFDQQMLSMRRCVMVERSDAVDLEITVEAEEELAHRIHAKLYKLLDLLQIELHPGRLPALRVEERSRPMGEELERRRKASIDCSPSAVDDG